MYSPRFQRCPGTLDRTQNRAQNTKPGTAHLQKALICLLALLTAACGWHLRGTVSAQATIDSLYFSARQAHGDLANEIRQQLQAAGVTLNPQQSQAPYSLFITEERTDRRVVGIGADALASAYELTLEADYDIRDSNDELLVHQNTASVIRNYEYSAGTAGQQEAQLLREMHRDLAQQILRRVYAVANQPREDTNGQTAP